MHIRRIILSDFRNFRDLVLAVEPGPVYVVGDNGAGKTNIVEAIHLLGLCRSFRTSRVRDTVRLKQARATVRADVASATEYGAAADRRFRVHVAVAASQERRLLPRPKLELSR